MVGVTDVTLAFLSEGRETPVPSSDPERPLPEAARLTMTVEGYGTLTQLFLIGGAR